MSINKYKAASPVAAMRGTQRALLGQEERPVNLDGTKADRTPDKRERRVVAQAQGTYLQKEFEAT